MDDWPVRSTVKDLRTRTLITLSRTGVNLSGAVYFLAKKIPSMSMRTRWPEIQSLSIDLCTQVSWVWVQNYCK